MGKYSRAWLLSKMPDIAHSGKIFDITHVYLKPSKKGLLSVKAECNIKEKKHNYYIIRETGNALESKEQKIKVNKHVYQALRKHGIHRKIEKIKYIFYWPNKEQGGYKIEIERFLAYLSGTIILRRSFKKDIIAEQYVLPDVFAEVVIKEISDSLLYSDANLTKYNLPME